MLIANMAGTGDDNILNAEERDLEYRKIQLQKLKEEVVDLEDLREGVSITDLGLNDFRVDLSNLKFRTFFYPLRAVPGLDAPGGGVENLEAGRLRVAGKRLFEVVALVGGQMRQPEAAFAVVAFQFED
jgi:hypothetical protein